VNIESLAESDAESGAVNGDSADFPPDLVEVVSAWPGLHDNVREQIRAIVKRAMDTSIIEGGNSPRIPSE
jgi:hypothetical protein